MTVFTEQDAAAGKFISAPARLRALVENCGQVTG